MLYVQASDPDVGGHALDMQAIAGHLAAAGVQGRVGCGRAVAADQFCSRPWPPPGRAARPADPAASDRSGAHPPSGGRASACSPLSERPAHRRPGRNRALPASRRCSGCGWPGCAEPRSGLSSANARDGKPTPAKRLAPAAAPKPSCNSLRLCTNLHLRRHVRRLDRFLEPRRGNWPLFGVRVKLGWSALRRFAASARYPSRRNRAGSSSPRPARRRRSNRRSGPLWNGSASSAACRRRRSPR